MIRKSVSRDEISRAKRKLLFEEISGMYNESPFCLCTKSYELLVDHVSERGVNRMDPRPADLGDGVELEKLKGNRYETSLQITNN